MEEKQNNLKNGDKEDLGAWIGIEFVDVLRTTNIAMKVWREMSIWV